MNHVQRLIVLPAVLMLLAVIAGSEGLLAQPAGGNSDKESDSPILQFGIFAGGSINPNSAEFVGLPGIVSCQGDTITFSGSAGTGFTGAAVAGMKPAPSDGFASHIGWSVKAGIAASSSSFETEEMIGQSISLSGELSDVVSRYTIDASLTTITVEPTAFYQVSRSTPFMIGLGPTLGFIMSASYEHREELAEPSGAHYPNGGTVRNEMSGDIEDTSGMLLGATLSFSYDIRLSPVLMLRPELSGSLGLNGVVGETDWKQHSARLGLSLLYNTEAVTSTPLGPQR